VQSSESHRLPPMMVALLPVADYILACDAM